MWIPRGKIVLSRENKECACQVHGAAVWTGRGAECAEGGLVRKKSEKHRVGPCGPLYGVLLSL